MIRSIMPGEFVVVKRSRRHAFGLLRVGPAWLRALLAIARSSGRRRSMTDLERSGAACRPDLAAGERRSGLLTPELVQTPALDADVLALRCAECERCVASCPSDALLLERSSSSSTSALVRRFELDPGRCIGCGECVRACPSNLLVMGLRGRRAGAGDRPLRENLLSRLAQTRTTQTQAS